MILTNLDWSIIVVFLALTLGIGIWASKSSGKSSKDFFLSGGNMPWWLLGISMVATTFSADTPNLVTDIVRKNGVSGNWAWWAFLLTGMLTVFVFAKLWKRSGVMTDLEFYELRYSGPIAKFLRGFRALYLGVIFNVLVMATVCLAAMKIGTILLGISPITILLVSSVVIVIYSTIGGLKGILYTDFFQFFMAMIGTIWASVYIVGLPEIGGLSNLFAHPAVAPKLDMIPDFSDSETFLTLLIIPLAIQWWSSYYPGAEPGGGGYIAQRMLASKDEKNAVIATLLFNITHYALRPWPWIIIALASLIMFPTLGDIRNSFPNVPESLMDHDLGYSAMLSYLPAGLLGLVIASLAAAFMSTISTHLNWGSSYITHDFYQRFVKQDASEKELVMVGRLSTVILMALSAIAAMFLQSAKEAFDLIILIGAGTGLLYILRWFWWRINALAELTAMIMSFVIAVFLKKGLPFMGYELIHGSYEILLGVGLTTLSWVLVALFTPPENQSALIRFYRKVKPASYGWRKVINRGITEGTIDKSEIAKGNIPIQIIAMLIGCILVYSLLFGIGSLLYGFTSRGIIVLTIGVISCWGLVKITPKALEDGDVTKSYKDLN